MSGNEERPNRIGKIIYQSPTFGTIANVVNGFIVCPICGSIVIAKDDWYAPDNVCIRCHNGTTPARPILTEEDIPFAWDEDNDDDDFDEDNDW